MTAIMLLSLLYMGIQTSPAHNVALYNLEVRTDTVCISWHIKSTITCVCNATHLNNIKFCTIYCRVSTRIQLPSLCDIAKNLNDGILFTVYYKHCQLYHHLEQFMTKCRDPNMIKCCKNPFVYIVITAER